MAAPTSYRGCQATVLRPLLSLLNNPGYCAFDPAAIRLTLCRPRVIERLLLVVVLPYG